MQKGGPQTFHALMSEAERRGVAWALGQVIEIFDEIIAIEPHQSWRQILHDAAGLIVAFLGAQAATIRIQERQRGRLVSFGSHPFAEELEPALAALEEEVAAEVVGRRRPRFLGDVAQRLPPDAGQVRFHSLLALPITIERFLEGDEDIPGAILLFFADAGHAFSPVEMKVAETMAHRLSYVLARKRILDLNRVDRKKEWIVEKLFAKVSLDRGVKMRELFQLMADELDDILRIQSCSLFTLSDDGKSALLETGWPESGGYHSVGRVFPLAEHPDLRVAAMRNIPHGDFENERIYPSYLLIKNPQASRLTTPDMKAFAEYHDIHSILYVPLGVGDSVRHLLVFDALDKKRFFSDEDIEILTFFGKELTQALEIERLDDLLHDFKNPAIAVAGFARRVRRMIEAGSTDTRKMLEQLDVVVREGSRLQEMAVSLYPLSHPETVDLAAVARGRFAINSEAIREGKLVGIDADDSDCEPGVWVCVPRLGLERVLDNLLNNATKALPPEGGTLKLKVRRTGSLGWVEIHNTGQLDAETLGRLTSADFRGRGLNIVKRFVRVMGGRIDVECADRSTVFRVTLPVADDPPKA